MAFALKYEYLARPMVRTRSKDKSKSLDLRAKENRGLEKYGYYPEVQEGPTITEFHNQIKLDVKKLAKREVEQKSA